MIPASRSYTTKYGTLRLNNSKKRVKLIPSPKYRTINQSSGKDEKKHRRVFKLRIEKRSKYTVQSPTFIILILLLDTL